MKIDVAHIAKLANLPLSSDEEDMFATQLAEVLEYVKKLDVVDTSNVKETSQVTGLENVFRDDIPEASLTQNEALSGTSVMHNGMFQVKGIFEDE